MKRFLNFLLFLFLLAIAVASVQVWSDHRQGAFYGWRRSMLDFVEGERGHRRPEKYTVAEGPRVDLKDVDVLAAMSRQRIVLARAVVPSVVSIITSRTVEAPDGQHDPFSFFHRGRQRNAVPEKQLGSGAIVSKEGHIVTNHHVIEGMEAIEVELSDGRRKQARLIGTDEDTDIAVLKIDAGDLQPLPFGDSDQVQVGETVMAVGNPYGLEESVTQGIISAKGRRGSENTSDLFQTDAAINPGNSGGPLINVRGELIGINEAIFSESGGWQGVGFAIPADTVRRTMDGILKVGRAVHGYLGIEQRPLDEDAGRDRVPGAAAGVVVDSIVVGSPAEKAAIKPGDVIQKFNNKTIGSFDDLRNDVAEVDVDTAVPVELLRNGKTISVRAQIAERPPREVQLAQAPHYPNGKRTLPGNGAGLPSGNAGTLGMVVHDLTPPDLHKLDLPDGTRGVLVLEVQDESPFSGKLQPGDVIEQINQQPVGSAGEINLHLSLLPENHPIVLTITRQHHRMSVEVAPG